jgi:hypothetical protein
MKKMRSGTKIAIGFVAVVAIAWFGFNKITDLMIMGQKFPPLVPGRVNIVGVNPGAGYRVIVSNELAQLVETQGGFTANESDDASEESAVKKRIPIRELIQSLQGNPEALGSFVTIMNDMSDNDLPPIRVEWTKEQLESAFQGDQKLRSKLENDLNMKLDGTPLPHLNLGSLENGIVIVVPVTVNIGLKGKQTPVTGHVYEAFEPRLLKAVQEKCASDNQSSTAIKASDYALKAAGYYASLAGDEMKKRRENVQQEIESKISKSAQDALTDFPKHILDSAFIVLNEGHIDNATYEKAASNDGKPIYNLSIDLNDEGRRRLWQFSRNKVGQQLLLVSDGIAIAAPRIEHPLSGGEITVTRMRDSTVLDDFLQTFRDAKRGTSSASR